MTTRKILVAYASRAGSTAGVAEAIARALAEAGAQVDVRNVNDVEDVQPYDAVVVGSAIRGKAWLPEGMQFLRTHQPALSRKPVAAFLVCITLAMPGGEQYRQHVSGFMQEARSVIRPVSEGLFAGALDYSNVALVPEGLQLRLLSAASGTPPGDYRKWDLIRQWAGQLPALLGVARVDEARKPVAQPLPSLVL